MEERIKRARKLLECINAETIREDLRELEKAIEMTLSYMREIGVVEVCKMCAEEIGSCCRDWVEDEVDEILILMNMLLGIKMPKKRFKADLCYFLSKEGCILKIKPVLCVSYICELIRERIGLEKERKLQEMINREIELRSKLKEKILRMISLRCGNLT